MTYVIVRWIECAGFVARTRPEFLKWNTTEARRSECCLPIPVPDFYGACIPTGDSRREEGEGGAYVECRAISLTRDVPTGLGWIIAPIIQKLPGESLIHTLEATRQAILTKAG